MRSSRSPAKETRGQQPRALPVGQHRLCLRHQADRQLRKYRWCRTSSGPQSGGAVEDLPLHHFESMGEIETKDPTEVLVSDPPASTNRPRKASFP
ncbi:type VI secretion system contractile sheath domain-containing protein [Pseudomonas aeruginosa]